MENLKIKNGGWVLVADGSKALFLRNEGDEQYPNLKVIEVQKQDNPPTRDLATDGPGTGHRGRPSSNRSAMEPPDLHQLNEDKFAKEIAEAINEAALANRFETLVVVAPPKTLAELRAHFHKEAQSRIIAELNKTLTSHPVHEIEKVLTAGA